MTAVDATPHYTSELRKTDAIPQYDGLSAVANVIRVIGAVVMVAGLLFVVFGACASSSPQVREGPLGLSVTLTLVIVGLGIIANSVMIVAMGEVLKAVRDLARNSWYMRRTLACQIAPQGTAGHPSPTH